MRRTTTRLITGLVAALLAAPGLSLAEQVPSVAPPGGGTSLLQRLGSPARPDDVERAVEACYADGSPSPRLLAETLGYAGGCAALGGLVELLDHPETDVRIEALEALTRVGLRSPRAATAVAKICRDREGEERAAAACALGTVGDGQHVDLLLGFLQSEDGKLRRAATLGLAAMTGVEIPTSYARWSWHCRGLRKRAAMLLGPGLARLDQDPEFPAADVWLEDLSRLAWLDLPLATEYLQLWSTSTQEKRRAFACRLAAALRLASFGDTVLSIRHFAVSDELRDEANRALLALGHCRAEAPDAE